MTGRLSRAILTLALTSCLVNAPATAQPPAAGSRSGLVVPVSAEAARWLATAEDCFAEGRWDAGIDLVIKLMDESSRELVPGPKTSDGVVRYGSVLPRCQALLSQLPDPGRAAYHERLDRRAEAWWQDWESSGDLESLRRIDRWAPGSSHGEAATLLLGEAAWGRGEFSLASRLWSQLLPLDDEGPLPWLTVRQAQSTTGAETIAARLILCAALDGRIVRARRAYLGFRERWPLARGSLGGEEGVLHERLAEILAGLESSAEPAPDVATYQGSISRQPPARSIHLAGLSPRWSISLPTVEWGASFDDPPQFGKRPIDRYPLIDRGRVFVTDGISVYGWNVSDGSALWGGDRGRLYPPLEPLAVQASDIPSTGAPQNTLTVADDRLFARLGSPVVSPAPGEFRDLRQELVCLDTGDEEGRLVWRLGMEELTEQGEVWTFLGDPLIERGRLYQLIHSQRPQRSTQLICLDVAEGELNWRTPLFHLKPPELERVNQIGHVLLTAGAGRIYLAQEHEAVVALDQDRGDIVWITEFPSPRLANSAIRRQRWSCPLPVLFDHDRLYVVAGDANEVKCLAADDGRVLWSRPTHEKIRQLCGVVERGDFQGLIVAGKSLAAYDVSTGRVVWTLSSHEPALQGYGHSIVTGERILWSARSECFEVDSTSGRVVDRRPWGMVIDHPAGGNLAADDGHLVVAGPDGIYVAGPATNGDSPSAALLTQRPARPVKGR